MSDRKDESTFSPGPWRVQERLDHADTKTTVEVPAPEWVMSGAIEVFTPRRVADAHLIAAGPDLYEALKHCLRFAEGGDPSDPLLVTVESMAEAKTAINLARAALAKASRGGSDE